MSDPVNRDVQTMMRYDANKKSLGVAYLLWFFFGLIGGHRFYLKRTGTAIAMLVLCVTIVGIPIAVIWSLVDAFLIPEMARDYNNRLIAELGG